ncbi:MAG: low temperature requirement protein A [Kineosporiaceae bacterium]
MALRHRIRIEATTATSGVTPLELFFDLVFVFAMTQVTSLMADDLSWGGLGRGLLILAVVWWCWVGYAWLGNVVRADEGVVRIAVFVAMGGVMLMALTIPEAFDDFPGGLSGPLVFALAYFVVRAVHLLLFYLLSEDDPGLRRRIAGFAASTAAGTGLLVAASQTGGTWQVALWVTALVVDYGGAYLGRGWRLTSPGHFAERHGLVIIIALGETVVAIGVGAADLAVSWPVIGATALGLTVVCSLWWLYFDMVQIVARRVLAGAEGEHRVRIARDAYSLLHLPMVAGIVLFALGLKKVLEYVADTGDHTLADALPAPALAGLLGGVALYLLAHVAFRLRMVRTRSTHRIVVAALLAAAVPVATGAAALVVLALLAGLCAGLVVIQAARHAGERYELRHAGE